LPLFVDMCPVKNLQLLIDGLRKLGIFPNPRDRVDLKLMSS